MLCLGTVSILQYSVVEAKIVELNGAYKDSFLISSFLWIFSPIVFHRNDQNNWAKLSLEQFMCNMRCMHVRCCRIFSTDYQHSWTLFLFEFFFFFVTFHNLIDSETFFPSDQNRWTKLYFRSFISDLSFLLVFDC